MKLKKVQKFKNDNTPAIDSKTLEAIKAQAMQSATLSDEQKAGIAAQAKAAAKLTDAQKAEIAAQAKLTDEQKAK